MNWTGRMMETIHHSPGNPETDGYRVRAEAKWNQGSSTKMVLILGKGLSEPRLEVQGEP